MRRPLIAALLAFAVAAAYAAPPADAPATQPRSINEPAYLSKKPLHLRVSFATKPAKDMLIVIDESQGDGKGYDVAYVDENMDGDLSDHAPKKFGTREVRRAANAPPVKERDPSFSFTGPCTYKDGATSTYDLNLYSLSTATSKDFKDDGAYFFWRVSNADKWSYFFINGKFHSYATAAEALAGTPVVLGGPCTWEISATQQKADVAISVGLKDSNGCTLRSASGPKGDIAPTFSVYQQDGKAVVENKKLEFG